MNKKSKLFIFSLGLLALEVHAASCCGAGFTVPSIITSDDKAQLAGIYIYSKARADVNTQGDWREKTDDDITETMKIEGAHIIDDRWQVGLSLPFQKRRRDGFQDTQGFGDVSTQVGYEYLPDWSYHPWRPKGIGYLSLIFPTGKSIYESQSNSGMDARGRGFWGLGVGTILTKNWKTWDANFNVEGHHSFEKRVRNKSFKGTIKPGQGGSLALGSGYNWSDFRLGGLITWFYEDPIDVRGTPNSEGNLQRYAAGTLVGSYMWGEFTTSLSYSDQTILGSPYNTALGKSLTLFFQKRWAR